MNKKHIAALAVLLSINGIAAAEARAATDSGFSLHAPKPLSPASQGKRLADSEELSSNVRLLA